MGYRFFSSLENNWLVFYHPFFNTFRVLSKKTVPLAPHVLNNTNRLKIQTVFTALSYYQSPSLNRCLQHCTKRILLCIYFYMGDETTVKSPKSNRHWSAVHLQRQTSAQVLRFLIKIFIEKSNVEIDRNSIQNTISFRRLVMDYLLTITTIIIIKPLYVYYDVNCLYL